MTEESRNTLDNLLERSRELRESGLGWSHAHGLAWLEERIKLWPADWGEDLQILIYGDYDPLKEPLNLSSLGIVVYPDKLEGTVIKTAMTVHKATVKVDGKAVSSLIDAARRVNVLLGSYTLVEWGNTSCGWWSWVTHGTGGGVATNLAHKDLPKAVEGILSLPELARRRVDAALFWIREPRNALLEFYRSDLLKVYAAYWNAFECLVGAVRTVRPQPKLSKREKQAALATILEECGGKVSPAFVQKAYMEVVNPGLFAKAAHALEVCFGDSAPHYIDQCFRLPAKRDRLYEIRNAINHGEVDAENPNELLRIESRLSKLWIMIWGMFGRLIPFPAPLDKEATDSANPG